MWVSGLAKAVFAASDGNRNLTLAPSPRCLVAT
jgi:hypothetical protein